MEETKTWRVRNVPYKTVQLYKVYAALNGMTYAEALTKVIEEKEQQERLKDENKTH